MISLHLVAKMATKLPPLPLSGEKPVPASIIRARTIFTEPTARRHWQQIEDGAVLQRDGVIAEIGRAAELIARHPEVPVLGTGRQVLLPGFVNARCSWAHKTCRSSCGS